MQVRINIKSIDTFCIKQSEQFAQMVERKDNQESEYTIVADIKPNSEQTVEFSVITIVGLVTMDYSIEAERI